MLLNGPLMVIACSQGRPVQRQTIVSVVQHCPRICLFVNKMQIESDDGNDDSDSDVVASHRVKRRRQERSQPCMFSSPPWHCRRR